MVREAIWGGLLTGLLLALPHQAMAQRALYEEMVSTHAKANGVPETLIHRVIVRESRYRPHLISRGNIGMMQIKLGTARALGYTGTAEGLLDPQTNLTWAVKYLAGAWRLANGSESRAVHYYASGYYYAAKRHKQAQGVLAVPVPEPVPVAGQAIALVQPPAVRERRSRHSRGKLIAAPRLDELTNAEAAAAKQ